MELGPGPLPNAMLSRSYNICGERSPRATPEAYGIANLDIQFCEIQSIINTGAGKLDTALSQIDCCVNSAIYLEKEDYGTPWEMGEGA